MPAGEKVGVGSDSEDRHGVRGMCAGSPTYVGFLVEKRDTRFAKRIDGLVHVLGILALAGTSHLIEGFEFFLLVAGYLHGIPEAEVLAVEALHFLPFGFGVLLKELREAVREDPRGTFLVLQKVQMEGIIAVAERQTACLMIGGDEDKGLVGVLQIEIIGYLHRIIHIPCLADGGCRIVGMAGVVDHTALDHHEEALVTGVEEGDGGRDDLRERQVALLAVDGIGEAGTMDHTGIAGLDED